MDGGCVMKVFTIWKRWAIAIGLAAMTTSFACAQEGSRVPSQATPEDVLAALVHRSAVIFAGEVYAIRMPAGMSSAVGGGLPSGRADAVVVEFRVDVGIRGASIGSNYVLHMPLSSWQQAPPFALHEHALNFLQQADASGFSAPIQGDGDLPGMDLGVIPIDRANQADLSRLQRLVTKKTMTAASMPAPQNPSTTKSSAPDPSKANPSTPKPPPSVTDVTTQAGMDTLVSGSNQGRMPELRNTEVPFLALIRDVSVLSAAEAPQGTSASATK